MPLEEYTLIDKIGQGTFGRVYTAIRHEEGLSDAAAAGRVVVLKKIDIGFLPESQQELCLTEVRVLHLLSQLNCPFIIRYHESFLEQSALCLVMEYAEKGSLHDLIHSAGEKQGLPQRTVWGWFLHVACGLHVIHSQHILHRDLKSSNIFLMSDGTAKIGDFGLARVLSDPGSLARSMVGTPYYISPEMCAGKEYGPKSDVWALGVVLHEMCTAAFPFHASNHAALIMKITRSKVEALPAIKARYGPILASVVARCLAKALRTRPTTTELLSHPDVVDAARASRVCLPPDVLAAYRQQVCKDIRSHPLASSASVADDPPPAPPPPPPPPPPAVPAVSSVRDPRPAPSGLLPSRRVRRGMPRRVVEAQRTATAAREGVMPKMRRGGPSGGYRTHQARARDMHMVASLPDIASPSSSDGEDAAAKRSMTTEEVKEASYLNDLPLSADDEIEEEVEGEVEAEEPNPQQPTGFEVYSNMADLQPDFDVPLGESVTWVIKNESTGELERQGVSVPSLHTPTTAVRDAREDQNGTATGEQGDGGEEEEGVLGDDLADYFSELGGDEKGAAGQDTITKRECELQQRIEECTAECCDLLSRSGYERLYQSIQNGTIDANGAAGLVDGDSVSAVRALGLVYRQMLLEAEMANIRLLREVKSHSTQHVDVSSHKDDILAPT